MFFLTSETGKIGTRWGSNPWLSQAGKHINHLDHQVHSFPLTALDMHELTGELALTTHSGYISWGNTLM